MKIRGQAFDTLIGPQVTFAIMMIGACGYQLRYPDGIKLYDRWRLDSRLCLRLWGDLLETRIQCP